jgi:SAM-dependent methyltransferase
MDEALERETENLRASWTQHDAHLLRDYLVAEVEDPRINVQSILMRHSLILAACGRRFDALVEQELRFAIVMDWARGLWEQAASSEDLHAVRHALAQRADNAEGILIPHSVAVAYAGLLGQPSDSPVPNYIDTLLDLTPPGESGSPLDDRVLSTFELVWQKVLATVAASGLAVLEIACGSANDYRYLESYSLARLIQYTGIDLCEKNIANAKQMFPQAQFRVGNALELEFANGSFDYVLVQDLFEHLSLAALERALEEVCRVARRGLCLGFFNAYEGDGHQLQPLERYHWNRLSVPRLRQFLERRGFSTEVIHIGTFLKWRLGAGQTHNPGAYTFLAERVQS